MISLWFTWHFEFLSSYLQPPHYVFLFPYKLLHGTQYTCVKGEDNSDIWYTHTHDVQMYFVKLKLPNKIFDTNIYYGLFDIYNI